MGWHVIKTSLIFALVVLCSFTTVARTMPAEREQPVVVKLFYDSTTVAGQSKEFIVKVHNPGREPIDVRYDPFGTTVLNLARDMIRPTKGWVLELVIEQLQKDDVINLSGKTRSELATVPSSGHKLFLMTPLSNRLPGKQLQVWAELRCLDDGRVYRSSRVTLRRE